MKINELLKKRPTLSFEIFPPKNNENDITSIYATIDELAKMNPDFREGRPKKFSNTQINHALSLLENHSYRQVEQMTGISKSTLIRKKKTENKA